MKLLSFLLFFKDSHLSCSRMPDTLPDVIRDVIACYKSNCSFLDLLKFILKKYTLGVSKPNYHTTGLGVPVPCKLTLLKSRGKVRRQIPPLVFTSGIYRYLPVWKILLKWQILANTGKLNFFCLKILQKS